MLAPRFLAAAAALTLAAGPAAARERLTDAEMDAARGGVLFAGGVAFEFGAVVRTFEDGVLLLQTQFTLTPEGPLIERLAGEGVAPLADGLDAAARAQQGYVSESGALVIQQLTDGRLTNLLVNTDSHRDFRQDTAVTLTLPGFTAVQADAVRDLTGLRLADDLNAVTIGVR